MAVRLALAGDTMLGRMVGVELEAGQAQLFAPEVVAAAREADFFVLNLECCISDRGEPWPDPGKPFFFRAPPAAVKSLDDLGVDCVTLANNHALDFGAEALEDTLTLLADAGIATTGAGGDEIAARRAAVVDHDGFRLAVVGLADHPENFAAREASPGIAFADLRRGSLPEWIARTIAAQDADAVLVTPHWGPNMTAAPLEYVRSAADELLAAGATVVAGHSAHVFHGVAPPVLYDLGDFVDDYATDQVLRNDLGLLWFVDLEPEGPVAIEVLPLRLDFCHTRVADARDATWIAERLRQACAEFEVAVSTEDGRLRLEWEH